MLYYFKNNIDVLKKMMFCSNYEIRRRDVGCCDDITLLLDLDIILNKVKSNIKNIARKGI